MNNIDIQVRGFAFSALSDGPDDGPLLLLLHGLPRTSWEWHHQMPELARLGYRTIELPIIFVDRREGTSKMSKKIAVEALFVVWWLRIQRFLGRLGSRPALKTTSSSAS